METVMENRKLADMTAISELAIQITKSVKRLPAKQMREVLNFIEYLEGKEDASFIGYVNERTRKAVQEKKRGKHLTTLKELQAEQSLNPNKIIQS